MSSWSGHQSRLRCPLENGHLVLVMSSILPPCRGLHDFPSGSGRSLGNLAHQVKLTLVIAAVRFSDDACYASAASLFQCAGASWPFRTRGRSMCDLAAGFVDADQGTGGSSGRRAAREKRPASRADKVRTLRNCLGIEALSQLWVDGGPGLLGHPG